ncbi:MAG: hypothetical protein ACM3U2_01295 [Deltaproteobacteria bacterium]
MRSAALLAGRVVARAATRGASPAGSWAPTGDHGSGSGGRLYQTTLSVMTLDVYYRYMPICRHAAVKPGS